MDYSLPGPSVHGILQARTLEWVAFPTQGLNPGLPPCRQILYQLSHKGSPVKYGAKLNALFGVSNILFYWKLASLRAQLVKNLPAMHETLVQFLGWGDPLKKG